ncbi:MAG: glycosyltransferase family 39 protein [Candidatus Omnitrophica bacterium]|nr:glycosyltransferase family 39 protein [Candidatus Omnitrophota bacterium]
MGNKYKGLLIVLLIFAAAFSIRVLYLAGSPTGIETDEIEHDNLAMRLLEERAYVDSDGAATSYRPPFYAGFLAFIYAIFGHSYFAVRVIQVIISSITVCILYLTAEKIFNKPTAIITGIFSSLYMTFIICSKMLYTETLFTFLLVSIIYLAIIAKKPGVKWFCLLGILCGIATLTRSAAVFLPFIVLFILLPKMRKNKLPWTKIAAFSLALALCFLILIVPWTVRNYRAHGKFVLVSTNGGINMYQGLCKPADGMIFTFPPGSPMSINYDTMSNEAERNNFFMHEAIKIYRTQPLFALKMFAIRFLFFWNIIDWEILGGNVINFQYIFMLPFAFLGTFFAFKENKEIWNILIVILYFMSFTLLFPGFSRYRMPIDGYIILLGSYGIYGFVNKGGQKIYSLLYVSGYFIFTYFLFKYSAITKSFVKGFAERIGLW